MGTSVTHRSPGTIAWAAVRVGYEHQQVPEERVLRDLWRAAQTEVGADWGRLLASPVVAECLRIADSSTDARAALAEAGRFIAATGSSSIAAEVAKRAVVGSFASESRSQEYVARVFEAATDYLVSRDLSGHIGLGTRNQTVREAAHFKDRLKVRTAEKVREVVGLRPTQEGWHQVVSIALRELAER